MSDVVSAAAVSRLGLVYTYLVSVLFWNQWHLVWVSSFLPSISLLSRSLREGLPRHSDSVAVTSQHSRTSSWYTCISLSRSSLFSSHSSTFASQRARLYHGRGRRVERSEPLLT